MLFAKSIFTSSILSMKAYTIFRLEPQGISQNLLLSLLLLMRLEPTENTKRTPTATFHLKGYLLC